MSADRFAHRFGRLIRARRSELGITQVALARSLLMSQPAISQWEDGKTLPTAQAMVGLLRALELELADVIALLDEPNGEEAA